MTPEQPHSKWGRLKPLFKRSARSCSARRKTPKTSSPIATPYGAGVRESVLESILYEFKGKLIQNNIQGRAEQSGELIRPEL
jgi:hypothetical protein